MFAWCSISSARSSARPLCAASVTAVTAAGVPSTVLGRAPRYRRILAMLMGTTSLVRNTHSISGVSPIFVSVLSTHRTQSFSSMQFLISPSLQSQCSETRQSRVVCQSCPLELTKPAYSSHVMCVENTPIYPYRHCK